MLNGIKKVLHKVRDRRRFCTAIVAAAGSSSRMGGANKLLLPLRGVPVIARTLQALQGAADIDAIVIAAREEELVTIADLCRIYGIDKPTTIVLGGETRLDSVLLALAQAPEQTTLFAVQDGARPLVTAEVIHGAVEKAAFSGAAAPAVPVKDTIKTAAEGIVVSTPDRSTLFAVQTPQVFDADLLKAALQAAKDSGAAVTDDCAAVERLGKEVCLTEGAEENIKITTPVDMAVAEAILDWRERL